jgi:hypothetical protein
MTTIDRAHLDHQDVHDALQRTYPLARIAEEHLPEGDPDRELLIALDRAVDRLADALDRKVNR